MATNRARMVWRVYFATAIVTALFWAVWWLAAGSVPDGVAELSLPNSITVLLPFAISRWWDILILPLWAAALAVALTDPQMRHDLFSGLTVGLTVGLLIALGTVLDLGLLIALGIFLTACLLFGLGSFLDFGLGAYLLFGLGTTMGVGLGFNLVIGPVNGLGFGLSACLLFGLGGILRTISWIFSKKFFQWLAGN